MLKDASLVGGCLARDLQLSPTSAWPLSILTAVISLCTTRRPDVPCVLCAVPASPVLVGEPGAEARDIVLGVNGEIYNYDELQKALQAR